MRKSFDIWAVGRLSEHTPCVIDASLMCIPLTADPICGACYSAGANGHSEGGTAPNEPPTPNPLPQGGGDSANGANGHSDYSANGHSDYSANEHTEGGERLAE